MAGAAGRLRQAAGEKATAGRGHGARGYAAGSGAGSHYCGSLRARNGPGGPLWPVGSATSSRPWGRCAPVAALEDATAALARADAALAAATGDCTRAHDVLRRHEAAPDPGGRSGPPGGTSPRRRAAGARARATGGSRAAAPRSAGRSAPHAATHRQQMRVLGGWPAPDAPVAAVAAAGSAGPGPSRRASRRVFAQRRRWSACAWCMTCSSGWMWLPWPRRAGKRIDRRPHMGQFVRLLDLAHGRGGAQRFPVPHVWVRNRRLSAAEAVARAAFACVAAFGRWAGGSRWRPQLGLRAWPEHVAQRSDGRGRAPCIR